MNEMTSVGDWVRERYSRAELFEKMGIDYCCGGQKSLQEACDEKKLPVHEVIQQLEAWDQNPFQEDCGAMTASQLCDHIEKNHHAYLKRILPVIQGHLEKIVRSHGVEYQELKETFEKFTQEITAHMKQEESVVFPMIRSKSRMQEAVYQALEEEHDEAGSLLAAMRALTQEYQLPSCACMTLQTTWNELKELEQDMHFHVFKENHLLFPLARDQQGK